MLQVERCAVRVVRNGLRLLNGHEHEVIRYIHVHFSALVTSFEATPFGLRAARVWPRD